MNQSIYCQNKVMTKKEVKELLIKGHDYFKNADFENSLKTLRVALYYSIKIKNDTLTAKIYNRIARNFGELSEDEKSLLYLNKGLEYAKKANDKGTQLTIEINIGNLYSFENKENVKKGIDQYEKALALSEELKDTATNVIINSNIAWTLFDLKKFDEGFPYLEYVNKYIKKFGESDLFPSVAMLNGQYFSSKNRNNEAKIFFENGVNSGDKIILKEDKQDLYRAYSEFLYKTENYKEAFENLKKANQIEKALYNENKLKKANVAGINFEIDEFKREIDKIETEKKLQAIQLKSSKTISYLFLIIALIFGLLLFMLYRNIRNKIKSNKKLSTSNLQLKEAKELAEEASKAKSQFVSTITHELRTPLYGVIGMTDILQDEHKELENNPHIKSLKFSAKYLLSLVNDILKINKLEENVTALEYNSIDLELELEAIICSLSFLVKKNNNALTYTIDKSLPKIVFGDKLRLTQILINLTGNALKFTQNGAVTIEVLSNKIVDKLHFIEFKIKDNGTGIAKEDQEKIFEKFVQVGRKDTDYQGTGLGLAIVKKLLDLFNSEIKLESTIGIGTIFSFVLALENNPEKTIQLAETSENELPNTENYKILVVEDNKINQVVSKKIIEKNLGTCTIANTGFEAISILENQTFDVILMDINMPEIDGYQTSIKIREAGNQTPIIALTASSKDQVREKVIASGMNDIIVKPFEPIVLHQTIKRNLDS
jgi:signal transduction histidine kinase/CheY-like chemotaxis protein/mannose/fructose/N-acetylgalactosamine-specific phosphotransferase system component IIB